MQRGTKSQVGFEGRRYEMRFKEKAEKHIFFFGRESVREQLCTRKEMRRGRKSENKKQPQVAKKKKEKEKKEEVITKR